MNGKKLESVKKVLGRKTGAKNSSWRMVGKIGVVRDKILSWKIGVKILSGKIKNEIITQTSSTNPRDTA